MKQKALRLIFSIACLSFSYFLATYLYIFSNFCILFGHIRTIFEHIRTYSNHIRTYSDIFESYSDIFGPWAGPWAGPMGLAGQARAQAKHVFQLMTSAKKDAQRPYDPFAGGIAPRSLLCVRKRRISFSLNLTPNHGS